MVPAEPWQADDATLVEGCLEGRDDAIAALYERFQPLLVGYCRGVLRSDDAEDIVQETFVRALQHLPRFDRARPLLPWLRSIARNMALDRARKRAREVPLERDRATPDAGEGLDGVVLRASISTAMARLTPQQHAAVRHFYLEDRSISEGARFMAISPAAFKQVLFRGRQVLRSQLGHLLDGAMVVVAIPARMITGLSDRVGRRLHRMASRSGLAGLPADAAHQLIVASLGVALLTASPPAAGGSVPAHPAPEPPHQAVAGAEPAPAAPPTPPMVVVEPSTAADQESRPRSRSPNAPPDQAVGGTVDDVKDPNAQTEQPEDSHMLAAVFSPRNDQEVFASGEGRCNATLCHPVLFRSPDGGQTWKRLPAAGFTAGWLLLPPAADPPDERIFAMGRSGLQVSEDGGHSFSDAAVGSSGIRGPSAISPLFDSGDPSILIGGDALVRYDDEAKATQAVVTNAAPGPFQPSYSAKFAADAAVFLGGVGLDPEWGTPISTVYRCVDYSCSSALLDGQELIPRVRSSIDTAGRLVVYAFTQWAVFRSATEGGSFEAVSTPAPGLPIADLAIGASGQLYAGVLPGPAGGAGGVYVSPDQGSSWTRASASVLDGGVTSLAVAGERLLATVPGTGLACSADGGRSWAPRCKD